MVGDTYPNQNPAYGPKGTDMRIDSFNNEQVAIFSIKTAKRAGRVRLIALPLNPEFEPWTNLIVTKFQEQGVNHVFPFTRQAVSRYVKLEEVFKDLTYPIERYSIKKDGVVTKVKAHVRSFALHALRHLRTTELVEVYGFDGFNLSAYGGWTIKTATGAQTTMFDRYISLNWQSYIPKLLKKRV